MSVGRQLMTIDEAAAYLHCSAETVRRHRRQGRIKAKRDRLAIGMPLLFAAEDLDAFRASRLQDLPLEDQSS